MTHMKQPPYSHVDVGGSVGQKLGRCSGMSHIRQVSVHMGEEHTAQPNPREEWGGTMVRPLESVSGQLIFQQTYLLRELRCGVRTEVHSHVRCLDAGDQTDDYSAQ